MLSPTDLVVIIIVFIITIIVLIIISITYIYKAKNSLKKKIIKNVFGVKPSSGRCLSGNSPWQEFHYVAVNLFVWNRFPLLNHQTFKNSAFVKGLRRAVNTQSRGRSNYPDDG